jgi:hypothetical protein
MVGGQNLTPRRKGAKRTDTMRRGFRRPNELPHLLSRNLCVLAPLREILGRDPVAMAECLVFAGLAAGNGGFGTGNKGAHCGMADSSVPPLLKLVMSSKVSG